MPIESAVNGHIIPQIELQYSSKIKVSTLPIIKSSEDVYQILLTTWAEGKIEFVEHFKVILLNRANRVLGICTLTTGCSTSTISDPKLVFVLALKANACNIVIAHNHPSGQCKPSRADEELTHRMKEAGKILEVKVLDHLIVTKEGYYSFADEGLL
jgi:DNA repair protein RadC